jgi:hypothetical protein
MKELATFVEIDAKPDRVWKHLAAFQHYGEWNPFITAVDGHATVGEKVTMTLRLKTADGRNQANHVIAPRIVKVENEHEIRWQHGTWFPGMLNFEHWLRISQRKGGVKVHQVMRVEGLLTALLKDDYFAMFREGFEAMNAALKQRVETLEAPHLRAQPSAQSDAHAGANDNAGRARAAAAAAAAAKSGDIFGALRAGDAFGATPGREARS